MVMKHTTAMAATLIIERPMCEKKRGKKKNLDFQRERERVCERREKTTVTMLTIDHGMKLTEIKIIT